MVVGLGLAFAETTEGQRLQGHLHVGFSPGF